MAQNSDFYKKIVEKYIKDANKYFEECNVIPDIGDLAGCIFDFWSNDNSACDLNDDDYRGLLTALDFDFEDESESTCPGWDTVVVFPHEHQSDHQFFFAGGKYLGSAKFEWEDSQAEKSLS